LIFAYEQAIIQAIFPGLPMATDYAIRGQTNHDSKRTLVRIVFENESNHDRRLADNHTEQGHIPPKSCFGLDASWKLDASEQKINAVETSKITTSFLWFHNVFRTGWPQEVPAGNNRSNLPTTNNFLRNVFSWNITFLSFYRFLKCLVFQMYEKIKYKKLLFHKNYYSSTNNNVNDFCPHRNNFLDLSIIKYGRRWIISVWCLSC